MTRKTSFDELYDTIGALVLSATGRPWWRKGGIQTRPRVYSTVYLTEAEGAEKQAVETIDLDTPLVTGESFQQTPWGTSRVKVEVAFYGSRTDNSAMDAAGRLRSALYIEERFWDLWEIAALIGGVRIIDFSAIFREDTEPRAEVRFELYANVADPLPLSGAEIFDIDSQQVNVTHVKQDGEEHQEVITVNDPDEDDSSI